MKSMISHHEVRIVELFYSDEEAVESQWIHKMHARSISYTFLTFMMLTSLREFNLTFKKWRSSDFNKLNLENFIDIFSHVMRSLKHLTIANCSLLLFRLYRMFKSIDRNTLMNDITLFRIKELFAHHIVNLVRRENDLISKTNLKKLRFLLYDVLTLRYIMHQIHIYVLLHKEIDMRRKLLITKNISLNAFFMKNVCNFIYVKTEILHAKLIDIERVNLINRFNDSNDSLLILIIMYQMSAQDVNLNKCCFRAIVTISAINVFFEIQTWSRVIRVNCWKSNSVFTSRLKLIDYKSRKRNSFLSFE
jgi:hypothetical protein